MHQKTTPSKTKAIFTVLNDKGLHTRPSTEIVKCAANFDAQITLTYKDEQVNAKSLLGILFLAAERGAKITVEAEGPEAEEAVAALLKLAKNRFHIKY
ncbi:MAG TPA: HPr family phosphocarrier protein [Chlamydiales bacterium]|jgi:phosphocarrier protein|nr:HPr family phosphocarrier protein [Chlamydiales bacterium]